MPSELQPKAQDSGVGLRGSPRRHSGPESYPSHQVLQTSLQKELTLGKGQASAMELLRCPTLRRLFLCLSMLW